MTTRSTKIIRFPGNRRHMRVRVTATGEFLRLITGGRKPSDDDRPRAA